MCPGNAIFRAGGQLTPLGLLEEKKGFLGFKFSCKVILAKFPHAESFTSRHYRNCSLGCCHLWVLLFLLLSSLPAFPCGLRGQQLEIKPQHFTVFDRMNYFAWVKFQAVPSKILNVIGPSSSRSSTCSSPIWFVK